jgi:hypothetical protein
MVTGGTIAHQFQEDGDAKMTIQTNGNVGIGTQSPGSYNSAGDNLVIAETSGGAGITLASATDGSGHILFADSTSGTGAYDGFIRYDHTTSSMRFATAAGVERLRIDSSGHLKLPNDNQQIKLGAGEDLLLYHDGSNTHIQSNTAPLIINQVANSTIEFKTNNTSAMTINASQNVGIGTAILDAGAKLNVVSGSSAYTAQFSRHDADDGLFLHSEAEATHYNWLISTQDNVDRGFEITPSTGVGNRTFSTPAFVIKADTGNVGIGTQSPGEKLEVSGNIKTTAHLVLPYGEINDAGTDLNIVGTNAVTLQSSAGTALTIPNASTNVGIGVTGGTYKLEVGSTQKIGYYGSSSNYGYFEPYNGSDGHMRFVNNWGASDAHILLLPDSNVGIGTASPQSKLDLGGSTSGQRLTFSNTGVNTTDGARTQAEIGYKTGSYGGAAVIKILTETEFDDSMALAFHTGTSAAESMRIDSSQNVGIGTQSPDTTLDITSTGANGIVLNQQSSDSNTSSRLFFKQDDTTWNVYGSGGALMFNSGATVGSSSGTLKFQMKADGFRILDGALGVDVQPSTTDGRIDAGNDVVAYSTSDKRLKDNIKPLDNALDKVLQISGVEFDWKELTEEEKKTIHGNKGHDVGVIAQEIEEVLPEVVTERDNGYKAVKYEKIVPLLIEAIKEQQKQINQLEEKLNG